MQLFRVRFLFRPKKKDRQYSQKEIDDINIAFYGHKDGYFGEQPKRDV